MYILWVTCYIYIYILHYNSRDWRAFVTGCSGHLWMGWMWILWDVVVECPWWGYEPSTGDIDFFWWLWSWGRHWTHCERYLALVTYWHHPDYHKVWKRVCFCTGHVSWVAPPYEEAKSRLQCYNKILNKAIREAKINYYENIFNTFKGDARKMWKAISEIMSRKKITKRKALWKFWSKVKLPAITK